MNYLYSLLIILINIFASLSLSFLVYFILFIPKEEKKFFGKHVPLTPALAFRLKLKFINFLNEKYSKYLYDFKNVDSYQTDSIATKWKNSILDFYREKFTLRSHFKYIPYFIKESMDNIAYSFLSEFISQFFKDFIPYLVEKYKVSSYLDLIDIKADVDKLSQYVYKYFYKYLIGVAAIIGFIIGLFNAILFIIFA